jgi:hypothetical protein
MASSASYRFLNTARESSARRAVGSQSDGMKPTALSVIERVMTSSWLGNISKKRAYGIALECQQVNASPPDIGD